ncbi:MAG: histidine kinase [Desulfobacca sp.]|nr:histidine kinase [Desulfobacca sp.]
MAKKREGWKAAPKKSEKRYSQIIQSLSIAAFVIDSQHVITYCNRAFENLTGISAGDLIGTQNHGKAFFLTQRQTLADYIINNTPEEEISRHYPGKFNKSDLIAGAYEAEDFFPNLGDGGKWLFFTAAPLLDKDGKIIGAIETLQDITDRKKTEQAFRNSERRMRALLDFTPYPVVVFTLDGLVTYLNPAFTKIFGWALEELEGHQIPYVPSGLEQETQESIKKFLKERIMLRYESQRKTKDGRILDVVIRAAIFSVSPEEPAGQIVLIRDVTKEKWIGRINEALLEISMALPEYPDLEDLLYYINGEVKSLLNTEGAIVILLDEKKDDLFILGAAYDDMDMEKKAREIRFPMDQLVAGRVIKSGEPLIVNDLSGDREIHQERDKKLGFVTRNLVLVPLKSIDRPIGVLCAVNKKTGFFEPSDVKLLNMIAGTVALSIENARVTRELKIAYQEVYSLNRAKGKAINHLSHELKTPLAILSGSINALLKESGPLSNEKWKPPVERIKRNLDRLLDIQYELDDILADREPKTQVLLSYLLDECAEELATLVVQESGQEPLAEKIRKQIDILFGPKKALAKEIKTEEWVRERIEEMTSLFSHREIEILRELYSTPSVLIAPEVLQKVMDGLLRNAVENTPDEGRIIVGVQKKGEGALLTIHDYGVGITKEDQKRIFEGFFPAGDTMNYSTKRPFDFNAGGKGADLLRMKILSERYGFQISMTSTRCGFIPQEADLCPGRISSCPFCKQKEDCYNSGETIFSVYFPPKAKIKQKLVEGKTG